MEFIQSLCSVVQLFWELQHKKGHLSGRQVRESEFAKLVDEIS